jgi:hypothetical protein
LLSEFYTASDRDGSRAAHAGSFRKGFKALWKSVLGDDTFREVALLICELVKDPVKKVSLSLSCCVICFWFVFFFSLSLFGSCVT